MFQVPEMETAPYEHTGRSDEDQSEYQDSTYKVPIVRIAVVGSRTFRDYRLFCDQLDALRRELVDPDEPPVQIRLVSGGALGADQMAERYAQHHSLPIDVFKPQWHDAQGKYNKRAGLERNTEIVKGADLVLAFWDGVSTGTRDSMRKAERLGIDVRVVRF